MYMSCLLACVPIVAFSVRRLWALTLVWSCFSTASLIMSLAVRLIQQLIVALLPVGCYGTALSMWTSEPRSYGRLSLSQCLIWAPSAVADCTDLWGVLIILLLWNSIIFLCSTGMLHVYNYFLFEGTEQQLPSTVMYLFDIVWCIFISCPCFHIITTFGWQR